MRVEGELEKKLNDEGYFYFEPMEKFGAKNPKTLILGTAPGIKSGATREYYAETNNNFWKVMEEIFDTEIKTKDTRAKEDFLNEHGIVLWDVFYDGYRYKSQDKFKEEYCTLNDIISFIKQSPTLKQIVIAGGTAQKKFKKYFKEYIDKVEVQTFDVISTSGMANGSWEKKKHEWLDIDW